VVAERSDELELPDDYLPADGAGDDLPDDGGLTPVDPVFPWDPAGPNPDYIQGYSAGYSDGYGDAVEKYDNDDVDEMALTFSQADLMLLGLGFLALALPLGILLSRTERPHWKLPWS
jgi:hypothetical protein